MRCAINLDESDTKQERGMRDERKKKKEEDASVCKNKNAARDRDEKGNAVEDERDAGW